MARNYWGTLLLAAAGIVGAALLNLVTPEIVRRLTGALTASSSGDGFLSERMIITYVIILSAAYLVRAVCRFLSIAVSHIAARKGLLDTRASYTSTTAMMRPTKDICLRFSPFG